MAEIHPSVYQAAQETFDRLWEHEDSKTCLRKAVSAAIAAYIISADHITQIANAVETQNRLLSQLDVARDTIRSLESHSKEAANRTVQMRQALHGDIPVETVESMGYGLHRGNVVLAKEMHMENVGLKAKLAELIAANIEYVGHRRETTWHRCKAGIKAYPTVLCSSQHEDESSNFYAVEALEQAEAVLLYAGFQRGGENGWKAPLVRKPMSSTINRYTPEVIEGIKNSIDFKLRADGLWVHFTDIQKWERGDSEPAEEHTLAEVVPFAYPELRVRIHAAANKAIYDNSKHMGEVRPFSELVIAAIVAGVLAAVEVKKQG